MAFVGNAGKLICERELETLHETDVGTIDFGDGYTRLCI
jgi:hypothetical protein